MNVAKPASISLVSLLAIMGLSACGDDDANGLPVGGDITLRNTLQDPGEPETAFPALFGAPDDAFDEFGVLSTDDAEFPAALAQADTPMGDISGLYDIDLDEDSISFTLLPAADDPFWVNVFGVFPDEKFDRYYFTFSEPHNIESSSSDNSSVSLRVDSPTVAVVEIGPDYDMNAGTAFTIDLN